MGKQGLFDERQVPVQGDQGMGAVVVYLPEKTHGAEVAVGDPQFPRPDGAGHGVEQAAFRLELLFERSFDGPEIGKDILWRPYVAAGWMAFIAMVLLAVTSTNAMMKKMGGKLESLAPLDVSGRRGGRAALLLDGSGMSPCRAFID